VELLHSVVWTSPSTPAQRMIAHFARLSPCAKTQFVTLTHFFVAQTVTISVATAGDFSLDLGFSCLTGVLGFLLKIWGLFDSGQILEIYVVLPYFLFKNTVVS